MARVYPYDLRLIFSLRNLIVTSYYAAVSFSSITFVERKKESLPSDRDTVIEGSESFLMSEVRMIV